MIEEAVRRRGFEIIEQIGALGFGVIYRAHQPSVGRNVAIKVILADIAQDPLFSKRFVKARLATQLEHPIIVPLHDYRRDEERAYLVMCWTRSSTLKDLLAHKPWESTEVIRPVDQVTGDIAVQASSSVLKDSEIYPVYREHEAPHVNNDVKIRLKVELTRSTTLEGKKI